MNQAMQQTADPFDITSIPMEFNPLTQNQGLDQQSADALYAQDNKLHIQFKTEAVLNPAASTKAGRPIFDDVDMIVIRTPGSQLVSIVAPAQEYLHRFGDKYRAWKSSQAVAASGTPLENFPLLFAKPSMIAELKYRNIFTVEQLAGLADSAKQSIMGGFELSRRATEWITQSAANAQDAEKEEMRKRMVEMEQQLAFLTSMQGQAKEAPAAESAKPKAK